MMSSSALGSTGTPPTAPTVTPPRPPSAKQPSSAWLEPVPKPAAGRGAFEVGGHHHFRELFICWQCSRFGIKTVGSLLALRLNSCKLPCFFEDSLMTPFGGVSHQLPDRVNASESSSMAASSAAEETSEKKGKEKVKKRPAAAIEKHEPLGGGNDDSNGDGDGDEAFGDAGASQSDIPPDLRAPTAKKPAAKTTPPPKKKPATKKSDLQDRQLAAVFFNYIQASFGFM